MLKYVEIDLTLYHLGLMLVTTKTVVVHSCNTTAMININKTGNIFILMFFTSLTSYVKTSNIR